MDDNNDTTMVTMTMTMNEGWALGTGTTAQHNKNGMTKGVDTVLYNKEHKKGPKRQNFSLPHIVLEEF
jgi:type V secretory pathway adhesin AidA